MARLRDLNAQFMRVTDTGLEPVQTLAEADYVVFDCPKCGNHTEAIPFPHVPKSKYSQARWKPSGTGIDDLTFVPYTDEKGVYHGSTSVLHPEGCQAHFYVRNGETVNC